MMPFFFQTILSDKMDNTRFITCVLLLTVSGLVLRAWDLSSQQLSADDIDVAISAMNYMERGHIGPTMWYHPVLRNILVHATLSLGNSVWALKIISMLLGSLTVPLLAITTQQMVKSSAVALLASFFLMLDPLHIDFSRQAIQEVYMMFFALLGILLTLRFKVGRNPALLFLATVSFGLGIASKWYVVFPMVITAFYLFYTTLRDPESDGPQKRAAVAFMTVTFVAVPAAVYLLTYIPWFERGHTLSEWFLLQKGMYREVVTHQGYNPYTLELSHKAYLWFLQPTVHPDFTFGENGPSVLIGVGNPLVWLLTIPSVVYLVVQAIRERADEKYFLAGLFIFTYLPLALTQRPIWAHTSFSVIPFAFIAVAGAVIDRTKRKTGRARSLIVYLLLVVIVTVPLYLLAIGKGFAMPAFKPLFDMYRPSFER